MPLPHSGTLLPVKQSLFPSRDTLEEAVNEAMAYLPVLTANRLNSILMTYHNTLLNVQASYTTNPE